MLRRMIVLRLSGVTIFYRQRKREKIVSLREDGSVEAPRKEEKEES